MRYSPVELRHVKVGRAFFGYRRAEVDEVISDAAESFEEVWAERGELADKLEDLSSTLEEVKQRESLLATTLVVAEKAAAEAVESAKRQGEVIIAEAHQEGRSIMRAALAERDRLFSESRRVETLLRAALGIVEESQALGGGGDSTHWPRHEDTREFHMVELQADSEELPAADASSGFTWG
jgi:cell division septum initiation protein DivIVA